MFAKSAERGRWARSVAIALLAGALVAGCSGGKDGNPATSPGPAGPPGPPGPSGPPGGLAVVAIGDARLLTGTITGVTVTNNRPTVRFRLANEVGAPVRGLTAGSVSFGLAQLLQPPGPGQSFQWKSYINTIQNPTPGVGWGTTPRTQATTEAATTAGATFKDNGDGSYEYTYSKDFPTYATAAGVTYNPLFTHRIGFEIRGTGLNATNNPVWTFQPSSGATTGITQYDVVNTAECAACHDKLEFHGGPRTDVQYCVVCHNPGTIDAQSNNSLDMKVMVHKIHRGVGLPTVMATAPNPGEPPERGSNWPTDLAPASGKGYTIWGFRNELHNYNDVLFTQDPRNCQTCHRETDPSTPQASNWRNVVNTAACGACHDDVNFATGANHAGLVVTDADCATCHGATSTFQGGRLRAQEAHRVHELEAAAQFRFEIVRVEAVKDAAGTIPGATPCTITATNRACKVLPGEFVKLTVRVTNPSTGATIRLTDPPFTNTIGTTTARLRGRVAWNTVNFVNRGKSDAQPIQVDFLSPTRPPQNADGTYTRIASTALPAAAAGTGAAFLEGRVIVAPDPDAPTVLEEIGPSSAGPANFAITDGATTPVARRAIVDIGKCNDCHKQLSFHGENRNNNEELCATCHNPEYVSSGTASAPLDMKRMIHQLHAGTYVYGTPGGTYDFSFVRYPGQLNNCEGCHAIPGTAANPGANPTYYPVDDRRIFATSVSRGAAAGPQDDTAITANTAVCSSCHESDTARGHMTQNGGNFAATKNPDGSTVNATETCAVCHGPGQTSDVKEVHAVGGFLFR